MFSLFLFCKGVRRSGQSWAHKDGQTLEEEGSREKNRKHEEV